VDHVVFVEVVDCIEHLTDRLSSVLFRELSLFANAVKQLSTSRQLSHNVVLVLALVSSHRPMTGSKSLPTLDSNQS